MSDEDFDSYVREILDHLRKSPRSFKDVDAVRTFCAPDIRQGYSAEVDEAARRYLAP